MSGGDSIYKGNNHRSDFYTFKSIFLIIFILTFIFACKNNKVPNVPNDNNSTEDNITFDNITSVDDDIGEETIVNVTINEKGEKVTEIYKVTKNIPSNSSDNISSLVPENEEILRHLSKYNNSCIDIVIETLKKYHLNDNIPNSYIAYGGYKLFEPTALHIAIMCGYGDVVKLLIKMGADIYTVNGNGENAIDIAYALNHHTILDILKKEYDRVRLEK